MPRRPARVTQADIARAIRAAKEAGATEVVVDTDGVIRIALTSSAPSTPQPKINFDEFWTPSEALARRLNGTESG
ncbi:MULTISPECIES: hypothetical protein [unclassified Bradyrhizobium]|uniref:hypothetical protein n=1 Tax=unclassified Bradyrhizobium TaxID=2631580 RepID=UPI0029162258|nr:MULTISPECIES: hypothetical protein [unclassified Bradyrhizobium]